MVDAASRYFGSLPCRPLMNAALIVPTWNGSSPNASSVRPHRGSLVRSTLGVRMARPTRAPLNFLKYTRASYPSTAPTWRRSSVSHVSPRPLDCGNVVAVTVPPRAQPRPCNPSVKLVNDSKFSRGMAGCAWPSIAIFSSNVRSDTRSSTRASSGSLGSRNGSAAQTHDTAESTNRKMTAAARLIPAPFPATGRAVQERKRLHSCGSVAVRPPEKTGPPARFAARKRLQRGVYPIRLTASSETREPQKQTALSSRLSRTRIHTSAALERRMALRRRQFSGRHVRDRVRTQRLCAGTGGGFRADGQHETRRIQWPRRRARSRCTGWSRHGRRHGERTGRPAPSIFALATTCSGPIRR